MGDRRPQRKPGAAADTLRSSGRHTTSPSDRLGQAPSRLTGLPRDPKLDQPREHNRAGEVNQSTHPSVTVLRTQQP